MIALDLAVLIVLVALSITTLIVARKSSFQNIANGIATGLLANVIAVSAALVLRTVYRQNWYLTPYLVGAAISQLLAIAVAFVAYRRAEARLLKSKEPVLAAGILLYTSNSKESFFRATGQDFGQYLRQFVLTGRPAATFKIIGIDCAELFGEAIGGVTELYLPVLRTTPSSVFQIILLDPGCRVPLEKRLSEWHLNVNNESRYGRPDQEDRIHRKILGSLKIIAHYHKWHPSYFQYKLVQELVLASCVLNGEEAIFYLYSRCHKGWDSPIFRVKKAPDGIYDFLDQYFDFLWTNPKTLLSDAEWSDRKRKLRHYSADLRRLVSSTCSGSAHVGCPRTEYHDND